MILETFEVIEIYDQVTGEELNIKNEARNILLPTNVMQTPKSIKGKENEGIPNSYKNMMVLRQKAMSTPSYKERIS
jgi:agmatine/peptidylarginine deiminase